MTSIVSFIQPSSNTGLEEEGVVMSQDNSTTSSYDDVPELWDAIRAGSLNKRFGNSIDSECAEMFTSEFNELRNDTQKLQRKVTVLFEKGAGGGGTHKSNKSISVAGEAAMVLSQEEETLHEVQAAHFEILRKKNAQIQLLMRREQYMVEKYEKVLGEKDEAISMAERRIHELETTAVTEAVEEAIKHYAHKNTALRAPIQTMNKTCQILRTALLSLSAYVKQQQKVMNVYAYRMKWQVHEAIHQEAPPEDVVQSLEAIKEGESAIPPCMRAELFGGVKLFAHIDHLMERAVSHVVECTRAKASPPVRQGNTRPNSMMKRVDVEVQTTEALQSTLIEPHDMVVGTATHQTLMNQMEEVTHRLEQPHVTEPQKKQLREVLAEAKAITKESAVVTMRSVVESVRERRQLQTLHEMYAQEVKKPQPTESTGVHRPIPRHVFCHQCGKGPFPLQRTWRCTNCYERLHRPPLMTMKKLIEVRSKIPPRQHTALDEKYASLFRRIEEHRARREAKLEETRRRLREEQSRLLQKIKTVLRLTELPIPTSLSRPGSPSFKKPDPLTTKPKSTNLPSLSIITTSSTATSHHKDDTKHAMTPTTRSTPTATTTTVSSSAVTPTSRAMTPAQRSRNTTVTPPPPPSRQQHHIVGGGNHHHQNIIQQLRSQHHHAQYQHHNSNNSSNNNNTVHSLETVVVQGLKVSNRTLK